MYAIDNPQEITCMDANISIIPYDENPDKTKIQNIKPYGCTLDQFRIEVEAILSQFALYVDIYDDEEVRTYMYRPEWEAWWFLGSIKR